MHLGSNLTYVQAFNRRIVLDAIRLHGPLSRADIARRTELSPQTVSNIVSTLIDRGLVRATGRRLRKGGGKPSTLLAINPSGGYSIGVNIYLDDLSGVLIDLAGNVHQHAHYNVDLARPDNVVPLIIEIVERFLTRGHIEPGVLLGVGVGLPGPLNVAEGTALKPPDYTSWHRPSVLDILKRQLQLPVFLENNANAAAIGERWYGCGRTIDNFIYVSFGMYLGGAIIIDGQLHRGVGGFAGEFGDMPIWQSNGEAKDLADCASPALLYSALASMGEEIVSLSDLEMLHRQHHPFIQDWLDTAAQNLAPTLIVAEYLLDPEVIIFGGRLPQGILEGLIVRLNGLMAGYRKKTKSYAPRLICSDTGSIAGALGAATLPIYDILAPHPAVLSKRSINPENESCFSIPSPTKPPEWRQS